MPGWSILSCYSITGSDHGGKEKNPNFSTGNQTLDVQAKANHFTNWDNMIKQILLLKLAKKNPNSPARIKFQSFYLWAVTLMTELSWHNKFKFWTYDIKYSSILSLVITGKEKNLPECLFYSNVQKEISSLVGNPLFSLKMNGVEERLHLDLFSSCWNVIYIICF